MPEFNRTGPSGQGSMTGRKMGACASNDSPDDVRFAGRGLGRGFRGGFAHNRGMGYGYGMRFRNQNFENIPETTDRTIIENEINTLKNQLSLLENKLSKTKGE